MKWLAAFCCAWLSASAQGQPVPSSQILPVPPLVAQQIAVAIDESARMSVPVTIGGLPWHFLIDTASTRSVIASDIADNLRLAKGHALQILSIGGLDTVPSVIIPELGFSDFVVADIAAPSLDRSNLGCDGLLGIDILRKNRLTIDFRRATALTISPSSRRPEQTDGHTDPDTIVVKARSRLGELIVTNAEIDGIAVAVILDTGSQDSIGNPALARLLFGSATRPSLIPTTLLSVTGRTLPATFGVVDKLEIGGVGIDNVPIAFSDVATFKQFGLVRRPAILLGMQTLRLFARVTIDFPRHEIRFLVPRRLPQRNAS